MSNLVRWIIAGLLVIVVSDTAFAQGLTTRQREVLTIVTDPGAGYLTKGQHNEFWSEFASENRALWAAAHSGRDSLSKLLLIDLKYELEFLRSAIETFELNKLATTPALIELRSRLLQNEKDQSKQATLKLKFERDDQELLGAMRWDRAQPNLNRVIENALTGKSDFDHRWGECLRRTTCTPAAVSILEARIYRGKRLLNPTWEEAAREWHYSDMYLTLQWVDPMQISAIAPLGRTEAWLLGARVDATSIAQIVFIPSEGNERDARRLSSYRDSMRGGKNAKVLEYSQENWKARETVAELTYSTKGGEGRFQAIRTVPSPEHNGTWIFSAISMESAANARKLLTKLDDAITLQ